MRITYLLDFSNRVGIREAHENKAALHVAPVVLLNFGSKAAQFAWFSLCSGSGIYVLLRYGADVPVRNNHSRVFA